MAVFTYIPDFGAAADYQPRVRTAQFGDGYSQRVLEGINPTNMEWDLRFVARSDAETDGILTFLAARAGVEAFDWTPPAESLSIRVICSKWVRTFERHGQSTVSAKFTRVYEP